MPRKINTWGRKELIDVTLPNHADSYTVISHKSVMDLSTKALEDAEFSITNENYRATRDGNIASAIYTLNFGSDSELSMMFAWSNSYNKQMRFKCGVGAIHTSNNTSLVCGDMGSWARKHTGSADTETKETIEEQVKLAKMYYDQLVSDKEAMKKINLDIRKQSQLLGMLFAEHDVLTTEQASSIKQQMNRATYTSTHPGSLWEFYNFVTIALQQSHPKTWMEDQRVLHWFISDTFKFDKVNVAPATTSDKQEPAEENEVIEGISVTDERVYGKKGIIIMIDDNGKQVSAIFKDKKNADKYNRNKAEDIKALLDLAKDTKYPNAIDESVVNEATVDNKATVDTIPENSPEETRDPNQVDLEDMIAEVKAEEEDEEPVDDTPEITGIPDGDKLSDTDDEFDADAEMQKMKTEEIIKEKIAEDEAAVAEVCDEPEYINMDTESDEDYQKRVVEIEEQVKLAKMYFEGKISDKEAADIIKGQEAIDQQMAQEASADNSVSDENIDDTLKVEPDFDLDFAPGVDEEEDVQSGDFDFDFA